MENITASELAGFGVGTILLCAAIAAPKFDAFISSSQRSSLGMCKRCGDVRLVACSRCKGVGSVKPGGEFGLNFLGDIYESLGGTESNLRSVPCTNCQARASHVWELINCSVKLHTRRRRLATGIRRIESGGKNMEMSCIFTPRKLINSEWGI
ncbi:hypothetical protein Ancab_006445 [Ancistrocladus abbreviatus]